MRGVYQITIARPDGSALVYVGQAQVIERRQREHLNALLRGVHYNDHLQRAFDKYGLPENGWFSVLELVPGDDPDELLRVEQYWFDRRVAELGRRNVANKMRPEKNPMDDPEARERHRAVIESEEWRAKQAEGARRMRQDPEWRAKQVERNRRLAQDPEWRAKQVERNRRLAQDPEWRVKQAAAAVEANAKRYIVITPDGEPLEVYNLLEFCRDEGLNHSNMVSVARGRRTHHKGYRCRYADEEEIGGEE